MQTFTWWDSEDIAVLDEHVANWRLSFPDHRVLGPAEAREALSLLDHDAVSLFDRIRIPACRSDLARLALLFRDGGLYVDAHCRVDDASAVIERFEQLDAAEIIVTTRWAPHYRKVMPHNSFIWARPNSGVIRLLLEVALERVGTQAALEAEIGFLPYHVWSLSGPGVFWDMLFDTDAHDGQLLPPWVGRVEAFREETQPITRHIFTQYRGPGTHWSERQKHEVLFESAAPLADPTPAH